MGVLLGFARSSWRATMTSFRNCRATPDRLAPHATNAGWMSST